VTAVASATILMKVYDEHRYVTNADDPWRHIGQSRAEYGGPWHVSKEESGPLSDIMQRDLSEELSANDDSVKRARPLDREMPVAMQDRNSDSHQCGHSWPKMTEWTLLAPQVWLQMSLASPDRAGGGDMPKPCSQSIRSIGRENSAVKQSFTEP